MDEKLSTEGVPEKSSRHLLLAGILLFVLLSLAFAAGFVMGRENNPPPIIIQTTPR